MVRVGITDGAAESWNEADRSDSVSCPEQGAGKEMYLAASPCLLYRRGTACHRQRICCGSTVPRRCPMYQSMIDMTIDRTMSRGCSPAPVGVAGRHVGPLSRTEGFSWRSFLTAGMTAAAVAEAAGEDSVPTDRDRSITFTPAPFARTTYDPGSLPRRQPV